MCALSIKDRLIKANQQIRWVPEHLKEGRFGKWLEGARDWGVDVRHSYMIGDTAKDIEAGGVVLAVTNTIQVRVRDTGTITDGTSSTVDAISAFIENPSARERTNMIR